MLKLTAEQIAMLDESGQQAYAAMVKENQVLSAAIAGGGKFSLKVGDKGGIVIYGFGRFPITLYREQWERFEHFLRKDKGFDTINAFITANAGKLKTKAQAVVEKNSQPAATQPSA